jgi:hypothetical protein
VGPNFFVLFCYPLAILFGPPQAITMFDESLDELARKEVRLYARVTASRELYNQAKIEARLLLHLQEELSLNHPDGRAAALKAARLEREAIEEYSAALKDFTDFILKKLPS